MVLLGKANSATVDQPRVGMLQMPVGRWGQTIMKGIRKLFILPPMRELFAINMGLAVTVLEVLC